MFNIKTMVVLDADVKNNYSSLEEIAMFLLILKSQQV